MTVPNLVVTAEERDFDPVTVQHFRDEGFQLSYIPYKPTEQQWEYRNKLTNFLKSLEDGEKYAIVAYGKAACTILAVARQPMPKLSALVCYYPDLIPGSNMEYLSGVKVMLHLIDSYGMKPACKTYQYPDSEPGFAGVDFTTYDKVAAGLAWSRTLGLLRQVLEVEVDLESIWDKHTGLEFVTKDVDATMATMVAEPYVNHVPTCTGGMGFEDLHRFYRDYFIPSNPPSMNMRLVSRTVGIDRVVDELVLSFLHTQIIPWMLPGLQPTGKKVEVALVVIVCIRGGKLYHEHIYWDQASVLLQLGLIDSTIILGYGYGRLPVLGASAAAKVLNEKSVESNKLLADWWKVKESVVE